MGSSIRRLIRKGVRLLRAFGSSWNTFWFEPHDPIVVCTMRLLVGAMLLYTHAVWGIELEGFFSPDGWQAESLVREIQRDEWAFSFWWYIPPDWMWTVHVLGFVCLACFFAGLATRVSSVLALIIVVSYSNRAPMANYGLDQINAILTFYLNLCPCGSCLSLDVAIKKWWYRRKGLRFPGVSLSPSARFASRLVQCHLCVIYFWSGISKLQGVAWWTGEAVWLAAANYEYQQVDLTWLAHAPWLFQLATLTTWMWEISFCYLVWNRNLRLPVLLIGAAMHLGIGLFLGMWTFGLIMIFAYTSFVPPKLLRTILGWARRIETSSASSLPEASTKVIEADRHERPTDHNLVIYVDHSGRRRARLVEFLGRGETRCIPVDTWSDAMVLCESLRPARVLFSVRHLDTEVNAWLDKLKEANLGELQLVGLVTREELPRVATTCRGHNVLWMEFPAKLRDIAAALDVLQPDSGEERPAGATASAIVKPSSGVSAKLVP